MHEEKLTMKRTCKTYDPQLKAKVALEAIVGKKQLIKISTEHNISKTAICEWRDKLIMKQQMFLFQFMRKISKISK